MFCVDTGSHLNVSGDIFGRERFEVIVVDSREEVFDKRVAHSSAQTSHGLFRLVADHALSYLTGYGCFEHQGSAAGASA